MPITLVIPMGCLGLTVEHSQEPVGIDSWSLTLEAEHCWAWIGGWAWREEKRVGISFSLLSLARKEGRVDRACCRAS